MVTLASNTHLALTITGQGTSLGRYRELQDVTWNIYVAYQYTSYSKSVLIAFKWIYESFFSGFNFTTASVVYITANINLVFISFSAVQIYDLLYIHLNLHHLRVYYELTAWPVPSWLDSSVGETLHRDRRRGHGFESHHSIQAWLLLFLSSFFFFRL